MHLLGVATRALALTDVRRYAPPSRLRPCFAAEGSGLPDKECVPAPLGAAGLHPKVALPPRRSIDLDLDERDMRATMRELDVEEDLAESDTDLSGVQPGEFPEEDESEPEPGWQGDLEGTNDPVDAPWRVAATEAIAACFAAAEGLKLADVHWDYGTLRVTAAAEDDAAASPTADQLAELAQVLIERFEEPALAKFEILERFSLEVTTKGASDVLTMQREFDAFKGFDVIVTTANPIEGGEPRVLTGKLVEKNPIDLVINIKGRMVKLPYHLVTEVRLPAAKSE